MKRAAAASVAFYAGIVSMLVGMISRTFGVMVIGVKPISFIHFANAWFLISIICLFHELLRQK